jgi:glycosyltransferase involved in cell wall biosynthesis
VEAIDLIDDIKIKWRHFGTGDQADELTELAKKKLTNKQNVEYELMGYVTNDKLHEYYMDHYVDIFITASSSEGNPVSVMEAMSYGIPVIAPAICNFPNMIKECGILVDEKCDPVDLSNAIREIAMMSLEDIRLLRDNVRKCWEEKFDAEKNNRRFVDEILCE